MKKITLSSICILFLIFISGSTVFAEQEQLGTISGNPVFPKDLPLKEYMFLYKNSKRLYDLKKRYFENYAFKMLITRLSEKHDLDEDEYLRTHVFSSILPITNKEVEDYIKKNKQRYKKFANDIEALKKKIKQGLLEEREDQKIEALKEDLFKKEKVKFAAALIKKPKFNILVEEDDAKLGPEKAKIDMIAFLDLECSYCRKIFPNLMKVKEIYGDNLRLVIKHFPLDIHRNAFQLSLETQCAGKQDAFFNYADKIFEAGRERQCSDCREQFMDELELDSKAFQLCLEDNIHAKSIYNDVKYGKKLGITSVPTIFINGYPIIGNVSKEELEKMIKEQLMNL